MYSIILSISYRLLNPPLILAPVHSKLGAPGSAQSCGCTILSSTLIERKKEKKKKKKKLIFL